MITTAGFVTRRKRKPYILKARQLGFTTARLIERLDDMIPAPNMNAALIAHEPDTVVKLFAIVKRAFDPSIRS